MPKMETKQINKVRNQVLEKLGYREGGDYFAIFPFLEGKFQDRMDKADIEIQDLSKEEFFGLLDEAIKTALSELFGSIRMDLDTIYHALCTEKLGNQETKEKLAHYVSGLKHQKYMGGAE